MDTLPSSPGPADAALDAIAPDGGAAVRLLGRLIVLFGAAAGVLVGLAAAGSGSAVVWELRTAGLIGVPLGALLLGLGGLVATLPLAIARADAAAGLPARAGAGRWRRRSLTPTMRLGLLARRPQGTIVPVFCALAGLALWRLWPATDSLVEPSATPLGAAAIALAFPFLVMHRVVGAARTLPEGSALSALLLLPVLALSAVGLAEVAAGQGFGWARWGAVAAGAGVAAVAVEIGLRAGANWFLPPPRPEAARAAVASVLASVLAAGSSGGGIAAPIRAQLGIDFSRSWALRFVRGAAVPVALLVGLVGWGLTGVALVPLDGRAVYERLGAPVAVWPPGAHVGLPWPLGRIRAVDLGVVHATMLGAPVGATSGATSGPTPAEAPAPDSANRLWDRAHPAETSYVIAAREASGAPSFQAVDADLTVLWRVGLDDRSALRAAYGVVAPDSLVRSETGRLVARLFARSSLDGVIGEDRERLAAALRDELQAALDRSDGGIEVTAVVIEAIHPPLEAARAYQDVQAAEITANTAIAVEQGRARTTASTARQSAQGTVDASRAGAAEVEAAARVRLREFMADVAAAKAGGAAFLLERYYANLVTALPRAPLIITDHRLEGAGAPVLDLRSYGAPTTRAGDDD